jgi:hypothetical protein
MDTNKKSCFEIITEIADINTGHLTIFKFTSGYKIAFGTPFWSETTRSEIEKWAFGKTIEEASKVLLENTIANFFHGANHCVETGISTK